MSIVRNGALVGAALIAAGAAGQSVGVIGGQTNVALDFDTLANAASLELSGVSADVINPGAIPGSVAFSINARDASNLPTTFSYDPSDFLGSFAGTIEHSGSVFFNNDAVEVGNFTIGFDIARAVGDNSGFFVESTAGIAAILFDIGAPSTLNPGASTLEIGADLLVSAEFGAFPVRQRAEREQPRRRDGRLGPGPGDGAGSGRRRGSRGGGRSRVPSPSVSRLCLPHRSG